MIYAMADIHGCYSKYQKMLAKIGFTDNDSLFIVGDILDRGEQPVKVLMDMSMRGNVFTILGNHEYMALLCLKRLAVEITEDNYDNQIDRETMINFRIGFLTEVKRHLTISKDSLSMTDRCLSSTSKNFRRMRHWSLMVSHICLFIRG